jgi:hypothetical protein
VTAAGPRRFVLIAAVFALVLLAGQATVARAASAPGNIAALRICSGCTQAGGDLSRYRYVILNSWDAPMLPALKAANPNLKALVYKNLSFTVSYGCSGGVDLPYQSTGVGYCDASSNHPDWFLTSPAGERLNSAAFAQAWMMDVGSPAYQAKWLSNVLADARSGGWDGVFMDDTNTDMSWHLNGRTIAKYQTPAAWRAATRSMLATVGPALKSSGLLAVPNLSAPWAADYDAHTTWSDWLQFTSGAAQEYYSKWGADSSSWFAGSDWTYRQKFQTLTEQAGKIFIGITYAPKSDTRSMAWARANFLLFDEPASDSALIFELSDPEAQDPYEPDWTADVGTPVGARFQVGSAWRRDFSGGTVLVNPTGSTVTVALEQTYLRDDGSSTTSVTLGPTSGAILHSSSAAAAPPPPPPAPPPPAAPPLLNASVSGTKVALHWAGLKASRVDVFRNGGRKATVANSGSYTDDLKRKPAGTYSYKVCAAGTATCTGTIRVTVAPAPSAAGTLTRRAFHIARFDWSRPSAPRRAQRAIRR